MNRDWILTEGILNILSPLLILPTPF